jgi:hypothetical protein
VRRLRARRTIHVRSVTRTDVDVHGREGPYVFEQSLTVDPVLRLAANDDHGRREP